LDLGAAEERACPSSLFWHCQTAAGVLFLRAVALVREKNMVTSGGIVVDVAITKIGLSGFFVSLSWIQVRRQGEILRQARLLMGCCY